ncbi:hypothetical protein Poli38472_012331 [Pythium oligandrum]|uniref:Uncharacterized protein n=1 Tax=Pythium oligandrum TaxID=41045 RepID=A0A8K1FKK6_PYTOL|nr:hypothetical protein Poli38472_012331 [Pythium oligandrum]|eukprot:TMW67215.1 hypothetical protein Poli38472_012331 [Pythium oligandrum]
MDTGKDTRASIYIIEIPVKVQVAKAVGEEFRVVQVGRAEPNHLMSRMRDHNYAWHYATGEKSAFYQVGKKTTPEKYTRGEIGEIPRIVGAIVRGGNPESDANKHDTSPGMETRSKANAKSEGNDGDTSDDGEEDVDAAQTRNVTVKLRGIKLNDDDKLDDVEAFVRDLVGVKLRTLLTRTLLNQTFNSDLGGTTVLKRGQHFSLTELRLVSLTELNALRKFFSDTWKSNVVRLTDLVNFAETQPPSYLKVIELSLECNYRDYPPSKGPSKTSQKVQIESVEHIALFVLANSADMTPKAGDASTNGVPNDGVRSSVTQQKDSEALTSNTHQTNPKRA